MPLLQKGLPVQLQRAMATEAEAAREARAEVIAAEGKMRASHSLKEASNVISTSPTTLQVRTHIYTHARIFPLQPEVGG